MAYLYQIGFCIVFILALLLADTIFEIKRSYKKDSESISAGGENNET